jgi:phenylacetic acid degradation operon negative regulatory protein
VSFTSRFGNIGLEAEMVTEAWDIDALETRYAAFIDGFRPLRPRDAAAAFVAQTRLVHEWRRFAFYDPVLPVVLLRPNWIGVRAKSLFEEKTARWLPRAASWFGELDRSP